ncbi:MAG: DUF3445 domain-containing protein [Pseudomonadota bacterium]
MQTLRSAPDYTPWTDRVLSRIPGMRPVEGPVFRRDECFAGQMALRDQLYDERAEEISALRPEGAAALDECLGVMLAELRAGGEYTVNDSEVRRPDGVVVSLSDPLEALARLVQEDVLLLEGPRGEHRLMGGTLAFPSRWSLRQKLGRNLLGIHKPVTFYPDNIAPRVQRLFDAMRAGQALWRMNWIFYPVPDHFTPAHEGTKLEKGWSETDALYLRCERQTLFRLPETGAVVFTIKTDICPIEAVPQEALEALPAALRALPPIEADYKGVEHVLPRVERVLEKLRASVQ